MQLLKKLTEKPIVSCHEYYYYQSQIREGAIRYDSCLEGFSNNIWQTCISKLRQLAQFTYEITKKQYDQIYIKASQTLYISQRNRRQGCWQMCCIACNVIGNPREMRHRYLDAMALVHKCGKPDISITMTCNPSCRVITEGAQNRAYLVARISCCNLTEFRRQYRQNYLGLWQLIYT